MKNNILSERHKKLFSELPQNSVLITGSAPEKIRTRDSHYPFRQDSNFYYLTDSKIKDVILCFNSKKEKILLAPPFSKLKAVWEGVGESAKKLAKDLDAKFIETDNFEKELKKIIGHSNYIFHQNTAESKVSKLIRQIQSNIISSYPQTFADIDQILGKLRLYKDASEIELIKESIKITESTFELIENCIGHNIEESYLANLVEVSFRTSNADSAFNGIVAAGKSAAVLHYHDHNQKLKKDSFLLVDIGAEKDLYCADLTRSFPIGNPSQAQRDVYQIVLEAQLEAIKAVKHGVQIKDVYFAAVKVLTQGLIDLKVLKGSFAENIAKRTYFEYFPHGIGHSLGIDTHDIGDLRGNNKAILEKNMVFTIEPGLYFAKPVKNIPAMGIRIEDDILVTQKSAKVLSKYPKDL